MTWHNTLIGEIFGNADCQDCSDYSSGDKVCWGVCEFMGGWACKVSDDCGVVSLEIGMSGRAEAEKRAAAVIAYYWPDGTYACLRNDALAAEHVAGATSGEPFLLHIPATPFELSVYQKVVHIPRGQTRTYGRIASYLNRPDAARAVANALAKNPVALLIPCHRVVPASGGTGGYRWGESLKARLIEAERPA
jgi:AraC family transcriptional regulator, regulatory protein of adaptative response / methylated-DNA-[protein]-cysteine methyltransferase